MNRDRVNCRQGDLRGAYSVIWETTGDCPDFHRNPTARRQGFSKELSKFEVPLAWKRSSGSSVHTDWLKNHVSHQGNDCLIWPFWRAHGGYGVVYEDDYRRTGAHRLMCKLAHGEPSASNLEAAHSCGNGHLGCVNPLHLSWKTRAENISDIPPEKRRKSRGEKHGRSRLTEGDIHSIREVIASRSATAKSLAKQYGVHPSTISLAVRGKNWSHI